MRLSGQFQVCIFFLQKNFEHTKTCHKPKPTNKTKLSKQKTTKTTIFRAEKLLRMVKLFILQFGAFFYAQNVLVIKINRLEIVL